MFKRSPDRGKSLGNKKTPIDKLSTRKNNKKQSENIDFLDNTENDNFIEESEQKPIQKNFFTTNKDKRADFVEKPQIIEQANSFIQDEDTEERDTRDIQQESEESESVISSPIESPRPQLETPREEVVPVLNFSSKKSTRSSVQERQEAIPRQTSRQNRDESYLVKQQLLKLAKNTNISVSSDIADVLVEIIPDFVERSLVRVMKDSKNITSDKIQALIGLHFENEDAEIAESPVISGTGFSFLIKNIITKHGFTMRRDAYFLLHLFTEAVIIKVITGADIISEANKRNRASAKDVSVAYTIYML